MLSLAKMTLFLLWLRFGDEDGMVKKTKQKKKPNK